MLVKISKLLLGVQAGLKLGLIAIMPFLLMIMLFFLCIDTTIKPGEEFFFPPSAGLGFPLTIACGLIGATLGAIVGAVKAAQGQVVDSGAGYSCWRWWQFWRRNEQS